MAARQVSGIDEAKPGVLRLNMLGPVEVRLGERRLDITAPQTLAMLAILAAEPGRTLSTTQLAAHMWADRPPTSASSVLRNHVHGLRRQFDRHSRAGAGAEWLGSTLGGYRLGLTVESDVAAVESLLTAAESDRSSGAAEAANEKLTAAQQLWRGNPLVGLTGPWAEKQRTRLRRLRSALDEAAIAVALDLGRYSAAVAELEALVVAEPHSERWYELLMMALYRAGRRVEALEVYRNARRVLSEDLGLEPGPRLAELHQEILSADSPQPGSTLVTSGELPPAEPDFGFPTLAPVQLPLDIADFVGREELVDELAEVLSADSGQRPVVAITGMGGIGKTTLAVHLAHRFRDGYPDGVLYLDLGGMDEQPRSIDMLLAVAFRSIGVEPGELPGDPEERTSLWRNLVASKRMLLVFDNARDIEQLTPLLPGPGAPAVLVTSRSSLTELFDARLVPLDVLTPDEAWKLLERMVSGRRLSEESEAAHEILCECGYLPLSLRIVGARLASRPSWQLASLAERLADDRDRLSELAIGNTSVELVFLSSYRRLAPELSRAFVLIAFSDAPHLSVAAIAALLDRDKPEAERLCETLVDLGMMQTPDLGRYRYHDLLRLFARRVADPEQQAEWSQALHRLVDFYLASAKNIVELRDSSAGTHYYAETSTAGQQFTTQRQCTAWAMAERFGLVALYRQVAVSPEARTRTLAVDLALSLAVGGDAGEHLPRVAQALDVLSRAAERDGDRQTMARAQLAAASARLIGMGDLGAGRALRQAGTVLHDAGDLAGAILAEQMLGTVMDYRGKVDLAVEHYRRAIELVSQDGNKFVEGMSWATIARTCCDAGRWPEAVEAAERSLVVAREVGSLRVESMALHELGFATLQRGNPVTARELCEQALGVARRDGRRHQEGWALARLAEVALRSGDAEEAVPIAEEAVRALTEVSAAVRRLRAMQVYGCALTAVGRVEDAEPVLEKVAQASRRIGLPVPDVSWHGHPVIG
ncbi:BTAD domain-containing putative transcriptional regulator [Nocardia sp. NPDC005998]|uniref:AfsR/SARP family transcriptional regulator n=1 Tax=Nocardia sp. NPDC005998 TaxID=3156894 RepID=UPI0033BF0BF5